MLRVSVYEDDPIRLYCDVTPDVTAAAQRHVTDAEYNELIRLENEYRKLQELLRTIRSRPELEWEQVIEQEPVTKENRWLRL